MPYQTDGNILHSEIKKIEDIIKDLGELGFSENESKIFFVLFEGNLLTATEIARRARIPRSTTYDILKSLTEKGICNEIQTTSAAKYEIIDPKIVEDKIEKELLETYNRRLSKLKVSFGKMQPIFKSGEVEGEKVDVELIKGFNKHRYAKFMSLWENSSNELLLMNKLEGYVDTTVDEFTLNFTRNGGKIKSLYEATSNFKIKTGDKWQQITPNRLVSFINELKGDSGEVRFANRVRQNMAIFDRKVVFISLVDTTMPKHNRSDIIIKNKNYAETMAEYFNSCWDKAYTTAQFISKLISLT